MNKNENGNENEKEKIKTPNAKLFSQPMLNIMYIECANRF